MKIRSISREIQPKILKNSLSHNVKESLKHVLDPAPEAADFLNVISSYCDRCLPVCKVWWRLLSNCDL